MNDYADKIKANSEPGSLSDKFEDEIRYSYHDLSDNLPLPPSNTFSRIMDTINIEEEKQKNRIKQSIFAMVLAFINDRIITRKVGWAMAGAQFAIIIFLSITPQVPDRSTFKTLSINSVSDKSIEINIIFKENAMQKDIRQLLNNSDAIIVNGPTENGLYILKVEQGHDLEIRLQTIKSSKIVKFADTRY